MSLQTEIAEIIEKKLKARGETLEANIPYAVEELTTAITKHILGKLPKEKEHSWVCTEGSKMDTIVKNQKQCICETDSYNQAIKEIRKGLE